MIQTIDSGILADSLKSSTAPGGSGTGGESFAEVVDSLAGERMEKTEAAIPPVPDLSNSAWVSDTAGTRAALVDYARAVIGGSGSVADKYRTLRENLPAELFSDTRIDWLNQALPGTNATAAADLVHAIDPYSRDTWMDPESGSSMNSLAAEASPGAQRVGYDPSGRYYDAISALDVAPGEYRDISDELALSIILGEARQQVADADDPEAVPAVTQPGDATEAGSVAGSGPAEAGIEAYLANAVALLSSGVAMLDNLVDDYT